MRRRDVHLSSWSVDLDRDPIRVPLRPLSLRHEDYEDYFDFTTIFYDCFWDYAGEIIFLIGPPLANLERDLDIAIFACPSMVQCEFLLKHVFLGCHVAVKPPAGTTGLMIRTCRSEVFMAPQSNLCGLFRGRRTILTLSKDNELVWIRDWIMFNRDYHGCDGVLIYDNGSHAYNTADLYDYLEPVSDSMQIVVLKWPFRYGAPDWRLPLSYGLVDSLYCQTGMLEHARRRFLSQASSVLNTDIDELVIAEGGFSIFELVEKSTTGLLVLDGMWVENYSQKRRRELRQPLRHMDFAWVSTADQIGCEAKWAVVPSRVPHAAQWHIHRIFGMPASESRQNAELRHFKAINTDWTVDRNRSQDRRTSSSPTDSRGLRVDVGLQEAFARIFPKRSDRIPATSESRPVRSAYNWRVRAGCLASERRWRDAMEAMQWALSLMPEHPGFRLFLARLQEQEKNEDAARALRAEAEELRVRDHWYHLQCGRWLQDEGDLVAAQRCFLKAIEIDPRFTFAYHELARNQYYNRSSGRRGDPLEFFEKCVQHVPDDAPTHAFLAKGLESKGRIHEALVHIEAAIELDPENPHYYCLHSRFLKRVGRLDAAERAARRGMKLDDLSVRMDIFGRQSAANGWLRYQWCSPAAPELPAELAEIMVAKGDLAAAEVAARAALSLARREPDRYYRLSQILAMRGCHEQAAQELGVAVSLARQEMRRPMLRDWPLTHRNSYCEARAKRLSRLLRAAGRPDEAVSVLREALVALPDSSVIKDNLATLLIETGNGKEAAALLRSAIPERPEDANLRHSLSKVLKATDPQTAIESARAAVELEPDNPSFRDHLIALLVAAERLDEARLALAAAFPLNRQHGPLYFHLSRLLQRRRRLAGALVASRRAVALEPQKAYLREHLVALLIEAGKDDEAEATLRDALELDPGNAGLHFHRSRLLQRRQQPAPKLAS